MFWSEIREEVKAYTLTNWRRWEEEKPEWFHQNFRASVPDDFIEIEQCGEKKER